MKAASLKALLFSFLILDSSMVVAAPKGWVVYWGGSMNLNEPPSMISTGLVSIEGQILTNATALAAGSGYALAIRDDSTVVGWGFNDHGQATGVPTAGADRVSGIVTLNGQILSNVVAISAEWLPVLALKSDGSLVAWGGDLNVTNYNALVSLCGRYRLAIRSDGTVVDLFNKKPIIGLSNIVAIAAPRGGNGYIVTLQKDGKVANGIMRGILDLHTIEGVSNAIAIAVGDQEEFALKSDGAIAGWRHPDSMPTGLNNVVAIAAGKYQSLALKSDGTVIEWPTNAWLGLSVPEGLTNVVAIAAGDDYSLAITTNSAVAEKFRQK